MQRSIYALMAICGLFLLASCSPQNFYGPKPGRQAIFSPEGSRNVTKDDYEQIFTRGSRELTIRSRNEGSQVAWIGFSDHWLEKEDCYQVNPGCYGPPLKFPSNDDLQATVIFFREGGDDKIGASKEKIVLHFPLYKDQEVFTVTDLMMMERDMMTGVFANFFQWPITLSDSYYNNYGRLEPGADTGLVNVVSGDITLRVQFLDGPNRGEVWLLDKQIDLKHNDAVYHGRRVDFNLWVHDTADKKNNRR